MLARLLHPLSILDKAWKSISMDFIVGLHKSNGMSVIFVVCDKIIKYVNFTPFRAAKIKFSLIRLLNYMAGIVK